MGAMHETFSPITAKDIAKSEGVNIATIRFRWNKAFAKGTFDSNRELSQDEVAAISQQTKGRAAKPAKPAPRKSPTISADFDSALNQNYETESAISNPTPAPASGVSSTAPGRAKMAWPTLHQVRRFLISALLFVVVILHGALIWYDCGALWGVPGAIGGGAVFAIVFAALLLASDATLPRTSGNALAFMFFVDCAAWKVHYEVFKTPVVENYITAALCAFICASSFVALWLFRDSKLD